MGPSKSIRLSSGEHPQLFTINLPTVVTAFKMTKDIRIARIIKPLTLPTP